MSSRNRKKIATRKKPQPIDDISIPSFPELKTDMDQIKEKIKEQKKVDYDPTDKYMCEACSIYLLYKNVNRHNETKCHIIKEKHNY